MTSASYPIHITDSHLQQQKASASNSPSPSMPQTPPSTSKGYVDGADLRVAESSSSESYQDAMLSASGRAEGNGGPTEHGMEERRQEQDGVEEKDQAPAMTMIGMRVAPPAVLPPSPPLTIVRTNDSEVRDIQTENGEVSSLEDLGTTIRNESRDDGLVNVRDALTEGDEEDMDEGEISFRRSRQMGDHPLRLNLEPSSPMPWEIFEPPSRATETHDNRTNGQRTLIPKSSYYFGPPPASSAYGTHPIGQIGVHFPREVLRIERDYSGGEVIQFSLAYPLELEGRITPTQFLETMNSINELLISAHSLRHAFIDNFLAIVSLQISRLFLKPHYQKEMERLQLMIKHLNSELYNPVGLNILLPRKVAFLFLEIEYY